MIADKVKSENQTFLSLNKTIDLILDMLISSKITCWCYLWYTDIEIWYINIGIRVIQGERERERENPQTKAGKKNKS